MAAAGKVCIGFSDPFVAKYNCSGGKVTFTNGMRLARGVSISASPETSDENNFYADNELAESENGKFTGGSVALTVDGLHSEAERFILGLPDPEAVGTGTVKFTRYGDAALPPYVGIGVVVRYQSDGVETHVPTIFVKAKFKPFDTEANTQKNYEKDWQTQKIEAALHRDDSSAHDWKWVGEDLASRDAAVDAIKTIFAVTETTEG